MVVSSLTARECPFARSRCCRQARLGNPTNDALEISNAFYRLGFQVQTLIDPDRKAFEDAIRKLGRDADGADASVFYYSGNALEVNGQNLLVPAPADVRSERDLRFETVDLERSHHG